MKKKLTLRDKAIRAYNSMIARCNTNKNYQNVSIDPAWINDRELYIKWFSDNYVDGWHCDKDLKAPYSNLYSPSTCLFVPTAVNHAIRGKKSNSRGNVNNIQVLPMGVSMSYSIKNPYQSHCKINGVQTHLGLFSTPEAAHRAWQCGKIDQLQYLLLAEGLNSEIIDAINNWIEIILDDIKNGRQTIIR
ncbi:hypothetical protein WKH49_02465 [Pantoea agglomerans]|uniref:hypothetical protein n=1 Tax=Enterobacter agglomerans TaxID=549 RepID=UPI003C7BB181